MIKRNVEKTTNEQKFSETTWDSHLKIHLKLTNKRNWIHEKCVFKPLNVAMPNWALRPNRVHGLLLRMIQSITANYGQISEAHLKSKNSKTSTMRCCCTFKPSIKSVLVLSAQNGILALQGRNCSISFVLPAT